MQKSMKVALLLCIFLFAAGIASAVGGRTQAGRQSQPTAQKVAQDSAYSFRLCNRRR